MHGSMSIRDVKNAEINGDQHASAAVKYFLSAHAYICAFLDGAIILDLSSGNYLGIDAEHLENLRAYVSNWPDSGRDDRGAGRRHSVTSESLVSDLLQRGILTESATSRQRVAARKCVSAIAITDGRQILRRVSLRETVQFSIAFLIVLFCHRRRLQSLLAWFRRRQSAIHRDRPTATIEIGTERLASFIKLRLWLYTANRRCLFDSLVLSVFLTREMVPCTFMIGVSTKPFLAHSWVQIWEYVLNDTAEHVQQFKPILSVGECEY
jgi:hypothetical protein